MADLVVFENGERSEFDSMEDFIMSILGDDFYSLSIQERKDRMVRIRTLNCMYVYNNNPMYKNMKLADVEKEVLLDNEIVFVLTFVRLVQMVVLEKKDANIFTSGIDKSCFLKNYIIINNIVDVLVKKYLITDF